MSRARLLAILSTLSLAALAAWGEEFISLQNVYSPPASGKPSSHGMWVAPYGGFGGVGLGGGAFPGSAPGMPGSGEEGEAMSYAAGMPPGLSAFPGGMPGGGNFAPPPPMSEDCVYSSVVNGLSATPAAREMQYKNGGGMATPPHDLRTDQVLQDAREHQLQQLDQERRLSQDRSRRDLDKLDARRRELEKERTAIRLTSGGTGASGSGYQAEVDERTIAIDRAIVELDFQIQQARSAQDADEYMFHSRRQSIDAKASQVHPVLNAVYRNQEALAGNGSLKPFVKELVSYVGFSVGGPAGLVIGSTVSTLLGGGIDKILARVKEALSKPEPRIEELLPLLQEVCRWRKFNQQTAKGLLDEGTREHRRRAREQIAARIDRAERELNACSERAEEISGEVARLEALIPTITNRVKQGKVSLKANWAVLQDLPIPDSVKQRLRETEDGTVAGLLAELNRARLSRSQFAKAYSRDAVQLNLGLLDQIRKTAESSMGNLSPDDSLQLQMILLASSNRLKASELELQRKLVAALDTEKAGAIAGLKKTYKDGTPALTGALIEVELPYIRAMRRLHERHNALQKEASDQESALLSVLEQEKRLLAEEQRKSPLKIEAAPLDPVLEKKL